MIIPAMGACWITTTVIRYQTVDNIKPRVEGHGDNDARGCQSAHMNTEPRAERTATSGSRPSELLHRSVPYMYIEFQTNSTVHGF